MDPLHISEDDDETTNMVFRQQDSSIENIDTTMSDIEDPLNFSIESPSEYEVELTDALPAKKTRRRFVWLEEKVFKTSAEAHAALLAEGYTPHDEKNVADGVKLFYRCKEVIARSEQCSSKRCIYQKFTDTLSRILRTTNAHNNII